MPFVADFGECCSQLALRKLLTLGKKPSKMKSHLPTISRDTWDGQLTKLLHVYFKGLAWPWRPWGHYWVSTRAGLTWLTPKSQRVSYWCGTGPINFRENNPFFGIWWWQHNFLENFPIAKNSGLIPTTSMAKKKPSTRSITNSWSTSELWSRMPRMPILAWQVCCRRMLPVATSRHQQMPVV